MELKKSMPSFSRLQRKSIYKEANYGGNFNALYNDGNGDANQNIRTLIW